MKERWSELNRKKKRKKEIKEIWIEEKIVKKRKSVKSKDIGIK